MEEMGVSISNNKKLTIYIIVFLVYVAVNFLEANLVWGTWKFDPSFKWYLMGVCGYLTLDLLGKDIIQVARFILRFLGMGKRND